MQRNCEKHLPLNERELLKLGKSAKVCLHSSGQFQTKWSIS